MSKPVSYKDAGVDISAADSSVKRIAELAKSTFTPNVLRDIGHFGAFYSIDLTKYNHPVLVSSVDGVGTKLKIAFMTGIHDTIGEDLVNHCVNDIMTSGADPMYFMDYVAFGKLDNTILEKIIEGLARGCRNADCSLVGGETAEMPDFYHSGEYDISGTIVGIVDKEHIVDGSNIVPGDVLIGLQSNGLHTNGYSLVRKICFDVKKYRVDDYIEEFGSTLGEELLRVHKTYRDAIHAVKDEPFIKGMSHITGGGIVGNTRRILPSYCDFSVNWDSWESLPVFSFLQREGNVDIEEMRHVFNLGIGFVFVVDKHSVNDAIELLTQQNENPQIIGEICGKKQ